MNLKLISELIPKRWILLLHYYLPFFKKPDPFYFKLHQFIRKHHPSISFNLTIFKEFLQLINQHSPPDTDDTLNGLINTILKQVIPEHSNENLLKEILQSFKPKDSSPFLIQFFLQLLQQVISNYVNNLCQSLKKGKNTQKWYQQQEQQVSWFFELYYLIPTTLPGKIHLDLLLSLPDNLIIDNHNNISLCYFSDTEQLSNFIKKIIEETKFEPDIKKLSSFLGFLLKWKEKFTIDNSIIFLLLNTLYKIKGEKDYSSILRKVIPTNLAIPDLPDFFQQLYNYSLKYSLKEIFIAVFTVCPDKTKKQLINELIHHAFKEQTTDSNTSEAQSLLSFIKKNISQDQIPSFQRLAIDSLTEKLGGEKIMEEYFIDEDSISKISLLLLARQEDHEVQNQGNHDFPEPNNDLFTSFSYELQIFIIEKIINALQAYIRPILTEKVPNIHKNKLSLHSRWLLFVNNNWPDLTNTKLQQLEFIIEEIPPDILEKRTLGFLKKLYQIMECPEIEQFVSDKKKRAIAYEEKEKERRELLRKIGCGLISAVSHQRMQELYGDKAPRQEEILSRRHKISFFHATDKQACEAALREVKLMQCFSEGAF